MARQYEIVYLSEVYMIEKSVCRLEEVACLKHLSLTSECRVGDIGLGYYDTSVSCIMPVIVNVTCQKMDKRALSIIIVWVFERMHVSSRAREASQVEPPRPRSSRKNLTPQAHQKTELSHAIYREERETFLLRWELVSCTWSATCMASHASHMQQLYVQHITYNLRTWRRNQA